MVEVLKQFSISRDLIDFFGDTIKIVFLTKKQAFIVTNLDKFYVKDLSVDEEPILVNELCDKELSDFSYGFDHVVGLTRRKTIYCWGHNRYGQLGNGTRENSHKPELIEFLSDENIIDIKCGAYHSLALTNNGEVYAWGGNQCGQIGNKSELLYQLTPHRFEKFDFEKIKAISCGCEHSLVLSECGHVYGWGDNRDNQLGLDSNICIYEPQLLVTDVKFIKISCGSHHSLLLSESGIIYSFGRNNFGQLGGGEKSDTSAIIKFTNFIDIAAHSHHNISVGLSVDNEYYVWGVNQNKNNFSSFNQIFAHYLKVTFRSILLEDTDSGKIEEFSGKDMQIASFENGKYENEFVELNELTEGTFGTLFKVLSKIDGKIYAIKKIPLKSNINVEQFKLISLLKNLDNDYVVQYYELWTENIRDISKDVIEYIERPQLFIRMEFYKITLKQFIDDMRKDSVLYFGRTLTLLGYYISSQIFIEILEAVDYMHKHNKFLGNLKPNNILLKKVSDGRTVRIADFYTRFIRDLADESKLRFKSSLKYFAPEYLADDLQEFDAKADVFSLGVIFQELLDINVNRIYEDSQNMSNILIKKYSRASEWCLKMTKLRIKDRPEVRDILKSRKSWTIEEEEGIKAINDEIDLNANKSNIYKFLRMKYLNLNKNSGQLNRRLSNKLNEYFERNIKLSFIYEKEVIIITKDDKFYKIGLNNNLSNLLGLNDGSLLIETALIQRLGKEVFKAFACGLSHVIALTEDGKIYCWGRNESGQLGNGITDFYDNEPQINHNLSDNIIEDIKCGSYHSLALTNGEVYAWGQNGSGQIGNDKNKDQLIPFKINSFGEEKIEAISCGSKHSLALTKSSHVFSWGLNDKGQLGNGEGEDSNVPKVVKVEDENKKSVICTKISCGSKHSLLLSSDGEIYAFGNNEFGQLGIENLDNKSFPTKIPNEKKFSDIASHFHSNMSFAKSNDNIFYYWGKCGDQIVSKPKETNFHSFNDLFLHYLKINYEPMKEGFSFDDTFIDNDRYFDLFENEKKLGSGNYGTVFKVMEKSTKKWFAIKKIAFKSENENQVLEQIKISDKIRKLDSKYLIKYFNAWFEEENSVPKRILLYIQMKVCDTKLLDIMEEMNENSNKNFDDVITYSVISELFFQLLCGVDYLHKQNIVHRNLNPSNILINKSIDKNFVKISGFGLAAFHEFEDHVRDQYRWHIKYAAPELLNGMISDEKVDIYSLGVVLQELFRIDFYGDEEKKPLFNKINIISEKTKQIRVYCEYMTSIIPNQRPNCEIMLQNKNKWALSEEDYSFENQFRSIPKLDLIFKDSSIYTIFKIKFSHKIPNQSLVEFEFREEIEIPVTKAKVVMKGTLYYQMSRKPRGKCLIIDNKSEEPFKESKRFESIFKQLFFDVEPIENTRYKTTKEIFNILKILSKDKSLSKHDALVVTILSHGSNGKIFGYNSCEKSDENNSISISEIDNSREISDENIFISMSDIVNIFSDENCIALRQAPKLFFFDCCRKSNNDLSTKEISTISNLGAVDQKRLDENRDTFIGYSCCEGCETFQDHSSKFSQFGQAFSNFIAKYSCEENLKTILNRTCDFLEKNAKLSNRPVPDLRVKPMRRQLYFNPGH